MRGHFPVCNEQLNTGLILVEHWFSTFMTGLLRIQIYCLKSAGSTFNNVLSLLIQENLAILTQILLAQMRNIAINHIQSYLGWDWRQLNLCSCAILHNNIMYEIVSWNTAILSLLKSTGSFDPNYSGWFFIEIANWQLLVSMSRRLTHLSAWP